MNLDSISYDRLVITCVILMMITLISFVAIICLLISRRKHRRDSKILKRSLRNLKARDQGSPILDTIAKA